MPRFSPLGFLVGERELELSWKLILYNTASLTKTTLLFNSSFASTTPQHQEDPASRKKIHATTLLQCNTTVTPFLTNFPHQYRSIHTSILVTGLDAPFQFTTNKKFQ